MFNTDQIVQGLQLAEQLVSTATSAYAAIKGDLSLSDRQAIEARLTAMRALAVTDRAEVDAALTDAAGR
jgi:hypothetical protein